MEERLVAEKLTRKQKRMRDIVQRMTEYMTTYTSQYKWVDYSDRCFLDDMFYGVAIALDPERYRAGDGYELFREEIMKPLLAMHDNARRRPVTGLDCGVDLRTGKGVCVCGRCSQNSASGEPK
jgi:hypothetical protein